MSKGNGTRWRWWKILPTLLPVLAPSVSPVYHFYVVLVDFLPRTKKRERKQGRRERKGCRTSKPWDTTNSQAILAAPRAVQEDETGRGCKIKKEREKKRSEGSRWKHREKARKKLGHERELIFQTNVTDRSNLHPTGNTGVNFDGLSLLVSASFSSTPFFFDMHGDVSFTRDIFILC